MLLSNYKSSDNVSIPTERSRGFFDCLRLRRNYKRNRKKSFSKKGQFYTRHHHIKILYLISNSYCTTTSVLIHINPTSFLLRQFNIKRENRQYENNVKAAYLDFTLCRLLYTLVIIIVLKDYLVTFVKKRQNTIRTLHSPFLCKKKSFTEWLFSEVCNIT